MSKIPLFIQTKRIGKFLTILGFLFVFSSCPNLLNPFANLPVGTPRFTPTSGTYSIDQIITIEVTTPGAKIYYTTDESTPTTSSTLYSSPVSIAGNGTAMTIKAIAVKSGMHNSEIATAKYIINYNQVSTPQFDPLSGSYDSDKLVTITSATPGASIYYTTDESIPTTSSTLYESPISITGDGTTMTIKTIAVKEGMKDSTVATAEYTITYPPQVKAPKFSVPSGTYTTDQNVEISNAITDAIIYYTTDGSTPTTSSEVYYTPIVISGKGTDMTIKAFALKLGMIDSPVAEANYSIRYLITTIAGTGYSGYSGDSGPAIDAQLYNPNGVAVDSSGNIYIADSSNHRIRKVDSSGIISTIAGTGIAGYSGDNGAATDAQLYNPNGIVVDSTNNIYTADTYNHAIRKLQ